MDADLRLVPAKLRIGKPKENRGEGDKRYKPDTLKEHETSIELPQCMKKKLQDKGQQKKGSVESLWNNYNECFVI